MATTQSGGTAARPKQFSIPAELVEHILLGPADDRRVLQDSPLLGDVWAAYALDPGKVQDVLITPHKNATAAGVASQIPEGREWRERERRKETDPKPAERQKQRAKIAYLQGLVAANLYFDEVLCILVPMTQWWYQPNVKGRIEQVSKEKLIRLLECGDKQQLAAPTRPPPETFTSLERYIALAGLIHWVGKLERPDGSNNSLMPNGQLQKLSFADAFKEFRSHIGEIVDGMFALYEVVKAAAKAAAKKKRPSQDDADEDIEGLIFQVSLNRVASAALERSIPAVKADAAHSLFKVSCKNIIWAVLDSGIDGNHDAFMAEKIRRREEETKKQKQGVKGQRAKQALKKQTVKTQAVKRKKGNEPKVIEEYISRVRKTFDFTRIREIVSNDGGDLDPKERDELADAAGLSSADASKYLDDIAKDAKAGLPINWALVEKLITLKKSKPPSSPHGTHVAGIIGADKSGRGIESGYSDGMCPDIRLYDFRVLGKTMEDTEFAVIAALQYIRYVNERHNYITIHGANLSLSIPHSVRNFACGRTPVCNECERLVESGVVVVAAAGNRGYQKFETKDGLFENYAAFSITDPGNGDSVITVGSTHSIWPHTYGVSFFSSRGPTGDGRLKPDLVAPGERIQSTVPSSSTNEWAPESGTSMAAPHVSGAAALLLARYEELVGQPRRVKRILCETATDLGRERSFQGHGMLDVLRAFQSI
jgi:hypothetical protein